ncbi:hypothetical protein CRUP_020079 [Coryphaenoides rupestris]|nr:hypothetical protein CRUP_020079 [Coryphaenoides rupestris]
MSVAGPETPPQLFVVDSQLDYKNGRLIILEEGFYYLYSKVYLDVSGNCTHTQLKLMKSTPAYGKPIDLMCSKRKIPCPDFFTSSIHCFGLLSGTVIVAISRVPAVMRTTSQHLWERGPELPDRLGSSTVQVKSLPMLTVTGPVASHSVVQMSWRST